MRTTIRLLIFLLLTTNIIFFTYAYNRTFTGLAIIEEEHANVTRVIDGDTIEVLLNSKIEKVRLLDINTPEKNQPYYQEAADFLKLIESKDITLISGKEDKDKYNRLLRYVFLKDRFINEEILKAGLANFYSYQDSQYTNKLKKAQVSAISNNKGIWEKSQNPCSECIMLEKIENGKGKDDCLTGVEFLKLKNSCKISCTINGWTLKDDASHIYKFSTSIPSSSTLTLYSGQGQDNIKENIFYYQNKDKCASIWNDAGDSIFLRDNEGKLALYYNY